MDDGTGLLTSWYLGIWDARQKSERSKASVHGSGEVAVCMGK